MKTKFLGSYPYYVPARADAQRAVRLVRVAAPARGLDPDSIGTGPYEWLARAKEWLLHERIIGNQKKGHDE